MSSTPTSRRFAVLTDLGEPSINETSRRADLEYDQFPSNRPSLGKRASRALARFLVTRAPRWARLIFSDQPTEGNAILHRRDMITTRFCNPL